MITLSVLQQRRQICESTAAVFFIYLYNIIYINIDNKKQNNTTSNLNKFNAS